MKERQRFLLLMNYFNYKINKFYYWSVWQGMQGLQGCGVEIRRCEIVGHNSWCSQHIFFTFIT